MAVGIDRVRFLKPVFTGDVVTVSYRIERYDTVKRFAFDPCALPVRDPHSTTCNAAIETAATRDTDPHPFGATALIRHPEPGTLLRLFSPRDCRGRSSSPVAGGDARCAVRSWSETGR